MWDYALLVPAAHETLDVLKCSKKDPSRVPDMHDQMHAAEVQTQAESSTRGGGVLYTGRSKKAHGGAYGPPKMR